MLCTEWSPWVGRSGSPQLFLQSPTLRQRWPHCPPAFPKTIPHNGRPLHLESTSWGAYVPLTQPMPSARKHLQPEGYSGSAFAVIDVRDSSGRYLSAAYQGGCMICHPELAGVTCRVLIIFRSNLNLDLPAVDCMKRYHIKAQEVAFEAKQTPSAVQLLHKAKGGRAAGRCQQSMRVAYDYVEHLITD